MYSVSLLYAAFTIQIFDARIIFLAGVSAEEEQIGLDISMHNESLSGLKLVEDEHNLNMSQR